jgi:diguanylate cyclase (GGDEF)-like protein
VAVAIENARLYAEVERLATLDELTGIANRRRLFELGQREFDRARRYGTPLAAVLVDLDWFKKINDTYGHNTGDRVLAGIASTINRNVRTIDLFGRYGGEEFVLLLPEADRSSALEVAERIRALVQDLRFPTARGALQVTISLGVAHLSAEMPSLAALIDRADQAMYAAKQAGRNRVEVFL